MSKSRPAGRRLDRPPARPPVRRPARPAGSLAARPVASRARDTSAPDRRHLLAGAATIRTHGRRMVTSKKNSAAWPRDCLCSAPLANRAAHRPQSPQCTSQDAQQRQHTRRSSSNSATKEPQEQSAPKAPASCGRPGLATAPSRKIGARAPRACRARHCERGGSELTSACSQLLRAYFRSSAGKLRGAIRPGCLPPGLRPQGARHARDAREKNCGRSRPGNDMRDTTYVIMRHAPLRGWLARGRGWAQCLVALAPHARRLPASSGGSHRGFVRPARPGDSASPAWPGDTASPTPGDPASPAWQFVSVERA